MARYTLSNADRDLPSPDLSIAPSRRESENTSLRRRGLVTPLILVGLVAGAASTMSVHTAFVGAALAQHDGSGAGSGGSGSGGTGSGGSGGGSTDPGHGGGGTGTGGTGTGSGGDGTGGGGTGSGGPRPPTTGGEGQPTTPGGGRPPSTGGGGGGGGGARPPTVDRPGDGGGGGAPGGGPTGGGGGGGIGPGTGGGAGPGLGGGNPGGGGLVKPPSDRGRVGGNRAGGGLEGKKRTRTDGDSSWSRWWEFNDDRFLGELARVIESTTGDAGFVKGAGRRDEAERAAVVTPAETRVHILPVLEKNLTDQDSAVVKESALALARLSPPSDASRIASLLIGRLNHPDVSVQSALIVSLGLLGAKEATQTLVSIVQDASHGRSTLRSHGTIREELRATAAFALGELGAPEAIQVLQRAILDDGRKMPALGAAAVLALSRFGGMPDDPTPFLHARLDQGKLAVDVAAEVPIALANLGAVQSIPRILQEYLDRHAHDRVEESCAIALGRLAMGHDEEVIDALRDKVLDGTNERARHFALIALGEIGARSLNSRDARSIAAVKPIVEFLLGEIRDSRHKSHQAFAALAAGILARNGDPADSRRGEIVEGLKAKLEAESNPNEQAAYVLALGLVGIPEGEDLVQGLLASTEQLDLAGYCALSLGLMGSRSSVEILAAKVLDDRDPALRVRVATALGLLGDDSTAAALVEALRNARTLNGLGSLSRALGIVGDRDAASALVTLVADPRATTLARVHACGALGRIAEADGRARKARLSATGNDMVRAPAFDVLAALD